MMAESKEKLLFVCMWGKNRETSWSGTDYSVYKALSKYYELEDINISPLKSPIELCKKVFRKVFRLKGDFDYANLTKHIKNFKRKYKDKNYKSFQFSECPFQENIASYVYQDLSALTVKDIYENEKEIFSMSNFRNVEENAIYKRAALQSDFYKDCKSVFTMSHWLREYLINKCGLDKEKVVFAGGGYNIDSSKIDYSKKSGNKILFVGRDFKRKNGNLVIEAFKKAKAVRTDLELYIAGPDDLKIKEDGINILGDLSYGDLAKYFNLCDVFCMPSKFEPYGLVFAEALTFGLPCIGRNAYEMPYFIEDGKTGYLLQNENADELAKLMLKAVSNDEMKQLVRSKKEKYIKEYSWETVAERMAKVISST